MNKDDPRDQDIKAQRKRRSRGKEARADLETLISTGPVGIIVFDAGTGLPVSINCESRRILGDLPAPADGGEQLFESLTFRRGDGREMGRDEFPLAQALSTGETVRAEPIVIQVPDVGSVTTLVSATPIRSEAGEVESVVVTLQDLTPLEELEGQRAGLLGRVSHELRTQLTSIRGSATSLLEAGSDRHPAEMRPFLRILLEQAEHLHGLIGDLLDKANIQTGPLPIHPEAAETDVTIPAVEGAATVPPRSPASPRQEAREETRILVVDDDPQARRYARDALSEAGYESIATAGPEAALPLMEAHRPDLVLLDLMGPGGGGLELMRDILGRADGPVIFLSGDDPGEVIARAFEAGAADYIVKPFSPIELVARLGAARRRPAPRPAEPTQPYVLGPLTVDYGQRLVTLADRPVALTAAEYELLFELSIHAGGVVTHNQLLRRLWGPTHSGDMRLLRTLVRRLRRKLADDATSPTYLFAEPRVGYRMPKPQPEPGTA